MNPDIPGYKIVELIGEGAMARVFLAIDEKLDRKVALKVMNQSLALDPTFRDRFLAEAKDTAKFSHPGIVSIHTTGVHDNNYYLDLDYLESGTLKDRQRARVKYSQEKNQEPDQLFSAQESLIILAQLADALAYAHSKNVIHRDIKPANILFRSDGKAVLSDFGIAKSVTENRELTMTGYSVGTPAYMSPEQKLGAADIDARSDLYSLGVVFFELLTGRKPSRAKTGNYADLRKELDADVPTLPDKLSYLQPLIDRMLAKEPSERFQSASELLDHLAEYSGEGTVIQRVPSVAQQTPKSGKKTLAMITALSAIILAVVVVTWVLVRDAAPKVIPVDEETTAQIAELLDSANLFIEMNELIYPASNAAEMFQQILALQPHNPDATAGLEQILEQVMTDIETEIENGNMKSASAMLDLALRYFPDSEDLLDLRESINP